jgi:hypothetical protein
MYTVLCPWMKYTGTISATVFLQTACMQSLGFHAPIILRIKTTIIFTISSSLALLMGHWHEIFAVEFCRKPRPLGIGLDFADMLKLESHSARIINPLDFCGSDSALLMKKHQVKKLLCLNHFYPNLTCWRV